MNSTPTNVTEDNYYDAYTPQPFSCDVGCIFYAVVNTIIFILGIGGNGLVIWIAGFKIKRSINATWYLSLALSDILFCCTLPISIVYRVKKYWFFGDFMCKFLFFNIYFNWFSSIFLLVIISVDRCVVVVFPVWAQNHRTSRKASVIVLLAWIVSAICSLPSAFYLEVFDHFESSFCYKNYNTYQQEVADVVCRFVFQFLIPLLIIIICYLFIIQKLKTNRMMKSQKPFKIMSVLIAAFLICWLPFHTVALMELHYWKYAHILEKVYIVAHLLANASSCLNPFLYTFMGKDFQKQCYAILSKIENAIKEDEDQHRLQGTAVTTSGQTNNAAIN